MFLQLLPYDVRKIWKSPVYEVSQVWSLWCQNGCVLWSYNSWADLCQLQDLAKLIDWLLLCFAFDLGFFWMKGQPSILLKVLYSTSAFLCEARGGLYWWCPNELVARNMMEKSREAHGHVLNHRRWVATISLSLEQKGKNAIKTDTVWTTSDKWDCSTFWG